MTVVKRIKIVIIMGALITNGASILAIMNRTLSFRPVEDSIAFIGLNGMLFGFYWFASKKMGSQDFKSIVEGQSDSRLKKNARNE